MSTKINIGILGCANIADRYVIPAINELNAEFNLVGVASRRQEKATQFSNKFSTIAFFDYDSLLNVSGLHAVYIPLPNQLHSEWIEKAIRKGLHVLVEKSLACSYQEVTMLNELAKQNQLVLLENFQFRFHSQLAYVQNLVKEGCIGELRCVRSSFGFPPFLDEENIRYQQELGGGALLDAGAYPIKLSQIFLGEKIQVHAANLFVDPQKGVDIWGGAYLKQDNGSLFSEIAFGFDHYYQCNLELWGSEGKIYTNRIFTASPGFHPIIELETRLGKETIQLQKDHHFRNMLIHFYNLINKKTETVNEYSQNINQARLITELRTKADEQ
ncbi:Gfo/Idh/MocA family protein [Crenothrix sp.]|uniref:Gfo/Idh/MocA family protein n=1 Tax=Crenothrix sp. TaxID=3100433 RepID=UPI00374D26E6